MSSEAGTPNPHPPASQSLPFSGSSPSALGEEVSSETAGPHLQGADGKGSKTGVRSEWVRGVQTTGSTWGDHGPGGGRAQEVAEGPPDGTPGH